MKAITLTQPWASLVAMSAKRMETRSWGTLYRGPLAIHAAMKFPRDAKALCWRAPFADCLNAAGLNSIDKIPLGAVLATTTLIDCVQMGGIVAQTPRQLCRAYNVGYYPEGEFGDFAVGRWAWIFGPTTVLKPPIPAKGALGLWEWKGAEKI